MKISELKVIIDQLDDNMEVTFVNVVRKETLKAEYWGNHDGRYNVHCHAKGCGYTSDDIPGNVPAPTVCPRCGGAGMKEDN